MHGYTPLIVKESHFLNNKKKKKKKKSGDEAEVVQFPFRRHPESFVNPQFS